MGVLTRSEMMAEADILNPLAQSMGASLSSVVKHKILSHLVDDTEQRKISMGMFEEPGWGYMGSERTAHRQIAPASIRIQSVKTRTLKEFQHATEQVHQRESELI